MNHQLNEDEIREIMDVWYELAEEYIERDSLFFSNPAYMEIFTDHMYDYIFIIAEEEGWYDDIDGSDKENDEDDLYEIVNSFCKSFLEEYSIPARQSTNHISSTTTTLEEIGKALVRIDEFPVQAQRSAEWYTLRYDRFSASNLWKLFGSPAQLNSLIYEKCKGADVRSKDTNGDVLMPNARNWGIKYEPVTVQIYEDMYKTKVNTNYGCLPHPVLPIGASPDGIVTDNQSDRYGRLVEIKNIFNREIDGIPSEEYWIQMQTQLEVCQLEMCDFVETRFKEYDNFESYLKDDSVKYKGIILFFLTKNTDLHKSKYVYMPLTVQNVEEWIDGTCEELKDSHIMYDKNYWYLDEFSCVQVERNSCWFSGAIPIILENWEVVLKERKDGFVHRAPKSRKPVISLPSSSLPVTSTITTTIEYSSHLPTTVNLVKLDWTT
jgi:hypothetical protein